jgi:catechol 2,3-dioxygenase-like lactoylglutathione lyase family enzyme
LARYVEPTHQLVVEVFVRDVAVSRAFYERLGFEVIRADGAFLELAWEGHLFFLDEQPDRPPDSVGPAANVRVMVPDVDRLWSTAREMGARVVSPIADRYYGLRDFTIADPDGFGLRFASWL